LELPDINLNLKALAESGLKRLTQRNIERGNFTCKGCSGWLWPTYVGWSLFRFSCQGQHHARAKLSLPPTRRSLQRKTTVTVLYIGLEMSKSTKQQTKKNKTSKIPPPSTTQKMTTKKGTFFVREIAISILKQKISNDVPVITSSSIMQR
jgi:hypothetical protein